MCRPATKIEENSFRFAAIIIIAYHCASSLTQIIFVIHHIEALLDEGNVILGHQFYTFLHLAISISAVDFVLQVLCMIVLIVALMQNNKRTLLIWQIIFTLVIAVKFALIITISVEESAWFLIKMGVIVFEVMLWVIIFLYLCQQHSNPFNRFNSRLYTQFDRTADSTHV